jgi:hypothetical protein
MKKLFRNWHRSKTQWFNGAIVLSGLVQANVEEFRAVISPSLFGMFLVAVGMIGWVLRTVTTQPIEEK